MCVCSVCGVRCGVCFALEFEFELEPEREREFPGNRSHVAQEIKAKKEAST